MLHGLVSFLFAALVIVAVAWIIIAVLGVIPKLPPPVVQIATWIIALLAFIAILDRALPLLGAL